MTDAVPAPLGLHRIEDLSWKQLLELDSCTKCGRCHEVCPARSSGTPLSPRDLVLDLREHADSVHGARLPFDPRRAQPLDESPVPLHLKDADQELGVALQGAGPADRAGAAADLERDPVADPLKDRAG
jgi:ferredoxin